MGELKAVRSFTGDEKEGFVKRNSVFETTKERTKILLAKDPKLVVPYEKPKAKEEKQAADKQEKEEKTAYQTKEEKSVESKDTKSSTAKKPGPKSKK